MEEYSNNTPGFSIFRMNRVTNVWYSRVSVIVVVIVITIVISGGRGVYKVVDTTVHG